MSTRMVGYLVVVVWVALASFPWASHAAVTIGHTGGNFTNFCTSDRTFVQTGTAPGNPSYEVPAGGGVITAWSSQAYASTSSLRLKVFRGPNPYRSSGRANCARSPRTSSTRSPSHPASAWPPATSSAWPHHRS